MRIAIVGAGELGWKVAEALVEGDHHVTVIDQDEHLIQQMNSQLDVMTIVANAKEIKVLKDLEVEKYDYLISVTGNDESNIVISSFAKKLGCAKVLARVRDPEHIDQMGFIKETMNIDSIVNPDLAITVEIYKYLVEKYTLSNGIFSSGKVSLLEFNVEKMPEIVGKSMAEMKAEMPDMLIVALSRYGKVIVPHGDTVIEEEDDVYIIGERAPIMKLGSQVYERGKYTDLQKVMIVGGGNIGLYLAQRLSEFGAAVKIIEADKERCHYLANRLEDVMILNGDPTDPDFLEEENLDEMDAFISATQFDEDNLLLALIASKHEVDDVIAKISRESYTELISSMGVDMALSPTDISASTILRFVQGSKRVVSSVLIQGQAELIEIIATDTMEELIDTPIKDMDLPDGMLFAAIHRGLEVIIPDGNTIIHEGDRVIIFSLLSEIAEVEYLLRVTEPRRLPFFLKRK